MTTPGTQSQDEQQLRNIEAQLAKFEQQNDVSMMSLIATNFVFVGKKVISRKGLEEGVKHRVSRPMATGPILTPLRERICSYSAIQQL